MDNSLHHEEKTFLAQMIAHHEMAIKMSKQMLFTVNSHDVESLCYSIIQTQLNEIALMKQLLNEW